MTNAQGQFRFLGLTPATYQLKAELEGFSTIDYPNIVINIGRNTQIEVKLSAAVEDVITVTAESPLLDERRISTGATVSQTELEKIPDFARSLVGPSDHPGRAHRPDQRRR